MEIADICEYICEEHNCMNCYLGNPCIGCADYDEDTDTCKSDGGCGKDRADDQ